MVSIFISHSHQDVDLVERLIALLRSALNIPSNEIRATSVDGFRLPGGSNTDEQLRAEVQEAKILIGLISEASLRSAYVTFELGARWGSGKPMVPLLAAGISPDSLGGPLQGMNALSCGSSAQLHQLLRDVARQLSIVPDSPAVYQVHLDEIIRIGEKKKQGATPASAATRPRPPRATETAKTSAADSQQKREEELLRLDRLLRPLPSSHISMLRLLSSGPNVISSHSQAKDSLISLKLIRYVGPVKTGYGLYEATSEELLAEYFRQQHAKQLPTLLAQLSSQELQFMSLFLVEDPLEDLSDPETGLMQFSVYIAHRSLEQKQLISVDREMRPFEQYAVREDVVPLLSNHLGRPVLRTEFQLDLNKVAASGSGGSGSPSPSPR